MNGWEPAESTARRPAGDPAMVVTVEHSHLRLLLVLLTFTAIVAITLGTADIVLLARVNTNTRRAHTAAIFALSTASSLAHHNIVDDDAERRTNYRICQRQQEVRAVMNVQLGDRFVLLDCTPDLYGHPARPLSSTQAASYIAKTFHALGPKGAR